MARWTATTGGTTKPGNGAPGDPDSSLQLDPQSAGNSTYRLEDYRFGMAGTWLRFFSIEPDANDATQNRSAIRAVSYQIIRYNVANKGGASLRYGLFRSAVRPFHSSSTTAERSTFFVGYDIFAMPYNDPAAVIPGSTGSQTAGSGSGDPGSIRRPDRSLLLANNVIDFGVRVWARNVAGDLEIRFPVGNDNRGFAATSDFAALPPVPAAGAPTAAQMTYGFPEEIEVFMRVLTDDGAEVLEAYERNPIPGTTWWELALENSEVYTRRIEIRGEVP